MASNQAKTDLVGEILKLTVFNVPKMDCPSEERLVRMALQGVTEVQRLDFDLGERRLSVTHSTSPERLLELLAPLKFGAAIAKTIDAPASVEKTVFDVPKMDCPSEERIIRMALEGAAIDRLDFDLNARRLTVFHRSSPEQLLALLVPLNFGAKFAETSQVEASEAAAPPQDEKAERSTLMILLVINAVMFVAEFAGGLWAQSTGLIADSLDMFADAAVYGVSLYAVGKAASSQASAARLSGYFQLLLALGALAEVIRRFVAGSEPEAPAMMAISLVALVANVACMALISKHRTGGVHMRASWIFSTNDVIANIGVILAGGLVAWTGSHLPDLVVGLLIALVVLSGAVRILRLANRSA